MSRHVNQFVQLLPIALIAILVGLPRAIGEDPTSRPATSELAATTRTSTSQLSDREIELREGRRIIEETTTVYMNCKSYQDEGEVVTVFFKDNGKRIDRKPFKTAFFRPDRFRFEFRDPENDPGEYIIWANGNDVRTWWFIGRRLENPKNLGAAISNATGVSSRSSHTIPALLLPHQIRGNLGQLNQIRYSNQEKSEGVLCNVLDGEYFDGDPVRIWIDAETKLVCKILFKKTFPDFRTEATTTYVAKINANIAAEDLEFRSENPSGGRADSKNPSNDTSASSPNDREVELREGRRMIEETAAVYKNCKSYLDEGEVVTVFFKDTGKRIDRQPFKTAFIRHDRFRFEFREQDRDPGQYIVWAKGNDVRTWWHIGPRLEKSKDLGLALAGATGVSGGSAHTIPALLLPDEVGGWSLRHLDKIRFTDQERSKGVLYNILDAQENNGDPVRIWIAADTKLVCKILSENKFPDFRTESTTIYKPKVNLDIANEDLEFNPPKE